MAEEISPRNLSVLCEVASSDAMTRNSGKMVRMEEYAAPLAMEKQSCSKPRQMARRSAWKNWRNIRGDSKVASGWWLVANGGAPEPKKKARAMSPRFAFPRLALSYGNTLRPSPGARTCRGDAPTPWRAA